MKIDVPHKEASSMLADPGLHQLVVRHKVVKEAEDPLDPVDTRLVAFDGVIYLFYFILFYFILKPLLSSTRLYSSIR